MAVLFELLRIETHGGDRWELRVNDRRFALSPRPAQFLWVVLQHRVQSAAPLPQIEVHDQMRREFGNEQTNIPTLGSLRGQIRSALERDGATQKDIRVLTDHLRAGKTAVMRLQPEQFRVRSSDEVDLANTSECELCLTFLDGDEVSPNLFHYHFRVTKTPRRTYVRSWLEGTVNGIGWAASISAHNDPPGIYVRPDGLWKKPSEFVTAPLARGSHVNVRTALHREDVERAVRAHLSRILIGPDRTFPEE